MIVFAFPTLNVQTPHTMEESRIVEQQLELVADPAYFPPEFCDLYPLSPVTCSTSNSKHRKISEKVDVWELGILMYYLAFFSTPFESVDGKIDTRSLIAGRFTFPANEAKKYSAEFLEIIRRLLTADVNKRPSIVDVVVKASGFTRWRMTQEASAVLDYAQQQRRKPVQPKPQSKKATLTRPKSTSVPRERSNKLQVTKPAQRGSSGKSTSSGKYSTSLELSDSDLSSSSDVDDLVQQKREAGEMTDRIRTSMLQYFGGKKNHTRWVLKCTSRVPEPPPRRSMKKIAIAAYENHSIDFYFSLFGRAERGLTDRRPLFASEIVAVKALTTTLCVFQLSTQEVVYQSFKHVSLLKEISTRWKIVEVGKRRGREA
ncbi:LOW QUALITY PROTEIN: uncharacterized protein [Blastocystis hominis]|uniref:non-specific serine/threonine protein kinase n=1 Tax=Blastocystis hominis TaxID=12968 RepID=D8M5U9_BLAHO|nr:LOW QUALITY PROTEIN: uncharacterized protein [Blastocystis hominis]CBK23548.2 unnamed protein product [Blastocystis hominis]|eukprot:XP_012897596.1 LOW QUALITY PROTEIN: uncharacterized protein [Blastocystis hominis]